MDLSDASSRGIGSAPTAGWRWEHSYAQLPAALFTAVEPSPVRAPRLVRLNRALAVELGLDPAALDTAAGAAIFAGNAIPAGARPLAQAYAGHQYGHFVILGDGRAILLGEQRTPAGALRDIQLKGAGPTPYSRRGDGRAALGPMLREYLISEAMHALGIPTTRSLAVATTGEEVWREAGGLPGAVLTRVAASHLRVGTFQFAAAQRDPDVLRALIDYTLRRHFPDVLSAAAPDTRAVALLDAVLDRQARLLAQWMSVGFVHGVMNTDNMALSGETIDYGPCAFLDAYDPTTAFSSIDRHGRYAYGNQPAIALWNLSRFAETLLPLIAPDETAAIARAREVLETFPARYETHRFAQFRRKLGLFGERPEDETLIDDLLTGLERTRADFTQSFAQLNPDVAPADESAAAWHRRWCARLADQPQTSAEAAALRVAANPVAIPRNHLVEAALAAAVAGDLGPFDALLAVLEKPFDRATVPATYRQAPAADAAPYVTYCGT